MKEIGEKIEASSLETDAKIEKITALHKVNEFVIKGLSPEVALKVKYNFGEIMVRLGVHNE
jgi:hypothetical protein